VRSDGEVTELRVITEPLGGSPLSLAAQRGDVPAAWYLPRPAGAAEWRLRCEQVAASFAGTQWLQHVAPALAASGNAAERLARAAAGNGIVVTTGQQPGLFGGPVYTFSKALSALAVADTLEAELGVHAAPVFWAATDDADFAEARWTTVAVDGRAVRLELGGSPPPGTPMSAAPLGDTRRELAELERASGSAAFVAALEAARASYRPEATVGGAYVALLRALLEPIGIAVLDASHLAIRAAGERLMREALRRAPAIAAALEERAAGLRAAGFEPQVIDTPDLSLVFAQHRGAKRRVPVGEARAVAETASSAALSPNVLLRPVLERALLPTVAYVAGPAELAYFAQVSAVSEALSAKTPLALPRWSGTIIEPHVGRILTRLGLNPADFREPHAVEGRLARAAMPAGVASALERLREAVDRQSAALATDPDASALIPGAAVEGARRSLLARILRLERRYLAAVKRRDADLTRQVATARAHLYPDGKRQERALNLLPMLARHGPPLIAAMRACALSHARALTTGPIAALARGDADAVPAEGTARP